MEAEDGGGGTHHEGDGAQAGGGGAAEQAPAGRIANWIELKQVQTVHSSKVIDK